MVVASVHIATNYSIDHRPQVWFDFLFCFFCVFRIIQNVYENIWWRNEDAPGIPNANQLVRRCVFLVVCESTVICVVASVKKEVANTVCTRRKSVHRWEWLVSGSVAKE
jgi:hypothetical protein